MLTDAQRFEIARRAYEIATGRTAPGRADEGPKTWAEHKDARALYSDWMARNMAMVNTVLDAAEEIAGMKGGE